MRYVVPRSALSLDPGLDANDRSIILEASTIGLPAGEWPAILLVSDRDEDLTEYARFAATRAETSEVLAYTYVSQEGHVLEVLND